MSKSTKLFIGGLCALLLLGILFRLLSDRLSNTNSSTPNFNNTTSTFRRVRFVGESPIVPSTLSQIQAIVTLPPLDQFLAVALEKTELTQSRYNPNYYTSSAETIQVNTNEHLISYGIYDIPDPSDEESTPPIGIDPAQAEATALQAVSSMFGIPSELLSLDSMLFFESDETNASVEAEDALMVIVLLNYTIEDIPLITNFEGNSTARVVMNSEYEPSVIELRPVQASVSSSVPYPTLTVDEAIAQINQNNGFVGNVLGQESRPVDLSTITSATLTSATIEYFTTLTDGSAQTLLPHYRFVGTATNAEGQNFAIDILTPAINTAQ